MKNRKTDFYPSVYEVELANHVFKRELYNFEESKDLLEEFTNNIAVSCSIAKVWERARMYQEEMELRI